MNDEKTIRLDRMRYTKNTLASGLALLSILFNLFYFISIYESNAGSWYYNILMGASILYNLIFMLAAFLCSEGVKNYKLGYAWVMIVLGAVQLLRIFIYPVKAHSASITLQEQAVSVMGTAQFTRCIIYLLCSAACLLAGAVVGVIRSRALQAHIAAISAPPAA